MAALLGIGLVAGRATGIGGQQSAAAQDPQAQDKSGKQPGLDKLAVQSAEAQLKLAQMNYERMKQLNEKVRGTLIAGMVEQFAEEVELAQRALDTAKNNPGGDPYQATIERMKLALKEAEEREKRALKTYEQAPDIVTKDDVERMRQIVIVADLQLQRGLALKDASPHEQLQWQLDVFTGELDRVRIYTYLLGQNRFGEFAPGL